MVHRQTYRGSCHCGAVAFQLDATPSSLSQCNCSICHRKGAVYVKVREIHDFRILQGADTLSSYQFNTMTAEHFFCSICGIHVFHRPRLDPSLWSVNARCLDDLDLDSFVTTKFDGRNWEKQARTDGWTRD